MELFKKLRRYDAFREVHSDFTQSSSSGAIVTLVCIAVMFILIMAEFVNYISVQTNSAMFVHVPSSLKAQNENLRINIDIDIFEVECNTISVDAQDVMGSHEVDVTGTIKKVALTIKGVKGCSLKGYLSVSKVPGNFHISTHANIDKVHQMMQKGKILKLGHRINHLSFGRPLAVKNKHVAYSPLDTLSRKSDMIYNNHISGFYNMLLKHSGSYEYYLKIVPTTHRKLNKQVIDSYQFSSSSKHFGNTKFPAVYFRYEFSPITVEFSETTESLSTFLIKILGIIGGIFTGFSLISTWLNLSLARIMKKANINKLG